MWGVGQYHPMSLIGKLYKFPRMNHFIACQNNYEQKKNLVTFCRRLILLIFSLKNEKNLETDLQLPFMVQLGTDKMPLSILILWITGDDVKNLLLQ